MITELNHLSGKAAVFVRGFIEHTARTRHSTEVNRLRPAQKAGMDSVEELGDTISVPYVSKLTKLLEDSNVITKTRKGKGYAIVPSERFEDVLAELHNSGWGREIQKEASADDITLRSMFLDHMSSEGIVRITKDAPLPKVAYQVAIDKFKAGHYDMVFVEKKYDLDLLDYGPNYIDRDSLNSDHTFTSSVVNG